MNIRSKKRFSQKQQIFYNNLGEKKMIMKGKVKWYNIRQGYGFISGNDGVDVFVHKSSIPFWTIYLKTGDEVEYIPKKTSKGLEATNLKTV